MIRKTANRNDGRKRPERKMDRNSIADQNCANSRTHGTRRRSARRSRRDRNADGRYENGGLRDKIPAAYTAGIRTFGENYIQEALTKVGQPGLDWPDAQWHFIGHLQRNKARDAAGQFALIQSVDSVELARELAKAGSAAADAPPRFCWKRDWTIRERNSALRRKPFWTRRRKSMRDRKRQRFAA